MGAWHRTRQQVTVAPVRQEPAANEIYLELLEAPVRGDDAYWKATGLGYLENSEQALKYSLRLASDPSDHLRVLGVVALARIHKKGLREAERALVRLTEDDSTQVRVAIVKELAWDQQSESIQILIRLHQDVAEEVRTMVGRHLHGFPDPGVKEAYFKLLHDSCDRVRSAAAGNILGDDELPADWPYDEIVAMRMDPSPMVRAAVASWCIRLPDGPGLDLLLELSKDSEAEVRLSAMNELSIFRYEGELVRTRALAGIEDDSMALRAVSADILGRWDDTEVTEALLRHAKDANPTVRKCVMKALEGRVTPALLPVLCWLSEDNENTHTRYSAARALASIPGEEAEIALAGMLKDPSAKVQTLVKRLLASRSKQEEVSPETKAALRYGPSGAKATRPAFKNGKGGTLVAWERFIQSTRTMEGVPSGSSSKDPAVVRVAPDGGRWALIPFGPAEWIRLECSETGDHQELGYAILDGPSVAAWMAETQSWRFVRGKRIAEQMGWV